MLHVEALHHRSSHQETTSKIVHLVIVVIPTANMEEEFKFFETDLGVDVVTASLGEKLSIQYPHLLLLAH